jgi:hypothetical protein
MPEFQRAVVTELLAERRGLQTIDTDAGPAYALTELTGPVAVGDPVILNTTGVRLRLGTGGYHFVHWNLANADGWSNLRPEDAEQRHLVKLRYTGLQTNTGGAEELHRDVPATLDGAPVVVCGVHSQIPAVVVAALDEAPGLRISYVMTDGGALPLAMSNLVAAMVDGGLLTGTVTTGHAFGGDLEAVSVPSGMTLARHVQQADLIVAGMGFGIVGSGTALGTTGVEVASILDTVDALGGQPVATLRMSEGELRERHLGLSHHTTTCLTLVRTPVMVAWPSGAEVARSAELARHQVVDTEPGNIGRLLADAGLHVTTMGRGVDEDELYFRAAAAAGRLAASLVVRR